MFSFCVFALCFHFVFSFCVFILCFCFVFSFCGFVLCFFAFGFRFKNTPSRASFNKIASLWDAESFFSRCFRLLPISFGIGVGLV